MRPVELIPEQPKDQIRGTQSGLLRHLRYDDARTGESR